jgi:hypothetical protein
MCALVGFYGGYKIWEIEKMSDSQFLEVFRWIEFIREEEARLQNG